MAYTAALSSGLTGGKGTELVLNLRSRNLAVTDTTMQMAIRLDRMEKAWGLDEDPNVS